MELTRMLRCEELRVLLSILRDSISRIRTHAHEEEGWGRLVVGCWCVGISQTLAHSYQGDHQEPLPPAKALLSMRKRCPPTSRCCCFRGQSMSPWSRVGPGPLWSSPGRPSLMDGLFFFYYENSLEHTWQGMGDIRDHYWLTWPRSFRYRFFEGTERQTSSWSPGMEEVYAGNTRLQAAWCRHCWNHQERLPLGEDSPSHRQRE